MGIKLSINKKAGFTIVELLIVILVISIVATIVVSTYRNSQASARDNIRMTDLKRAKDALLFYHQDNGNWIEAGSGCGYSGNGAGYFSYEGTNYPRSISGCLVDAGYLDKDIVDPTGGKSSTATTGYSYMKYTCVLGGSTVTYLYAKLEAVPQSTTATDGTCASGADSSYGMNYYLKVD